MVRITWVIGLLVVLTLVPSLDAGQLMLQWTAPMLNEDGTALTDLAGYVVYYSQQSRAVSGGYPDAIRIGTQTTYALTNLIDGATYYVAVTAVDTSNNESVFSNEASAIASTPVVPPTSALVLAFNFNEGSGTIAHDQSGLGNNGLLSGPVWTSSGKYDKALNFDGQNDLVTVPDSPSLDLTSGMTLMAWVRSTTTSGTRDVLIKEGPSGDIYNLYYRNWRGRPEMNALVNGQINQTAEGSTLPANVWIHLSGTYDGRTLRFYRDGVQVATRVVTGTVPTTTQPLRIGGNRIWGEYFKGRIDEVRVYNRALSVNEIQADRSTPIP